MSDCAIYIVSPVFYLGRVVFYYLSVSLSAWQPALWALSLKRFRTGLGFMNIKAVIYTRVLSGEKLLR